MKRLLIIATLLFCSVAIVGCYPSQEDLQTKVAGTIEAWPTATADRWPSKHTPQPSSGSSRSTSCTANEYKAEAIPQMQRIGDLSKNIELDTDATVKDAQKKLSIILNDMKKMKCAKDYPFKQETLEYTAIHTIRALDSWLEGDFVAFDESMDSAILNTGWFNDWSLDMD